jgi:type IV pilus assembly protein PilW
MPARRIAAQRGLTLVELLVSLLLTSVLALACASLYQAGGTAYRTVDEAQALQDTGRFVLEVIGRSVRNAGFRNHSMPATTTGLPGIRGFDNSKASAVKVNEGDGDARGRGVNQSDTLALRFHGTSPPGDPATPDGAAMDCLGIAQRAPSTPADVGLSLFAVEISSSGEPELRCTSSGKPSSRSRQTQPIAMGVETFQVAYGTDANEDGTADRWTDATSVTDWTAIVAVRVGMVLRGGIGSAQGKKDSAAGGKLYPLGETFAGAGHEGREFTVPADGRLRRVVGATFQLRNPQD